MLERAGEPGRSFPPGFLWGAATSAHQVEGGNTLNDWWRFEHVPGVIRGGLGSGDACRHYERFDADFSLAAADGHNAHRLSFEWSRLEPRPGRFDPAAQQHRCGRPPRARSLRVGLARGLAGALVGQADHDGGAVGVRGVGGGIARHGLAARREGGQGGDGN